MHACAFILLPQVQGEEVHARALILLPPLPRSLYLSLA